MLIVTRNFDLSVGSAVAFVGVILALLTVKHDVNASARRGNRHCRRHSDGCLARLLGDAPWRLVLYRHARRMLYFRGISMIATNGATVAPLPRSLTGLATGFLSPALSISAVVISLARLCRPALR